MRKLVLHGSVERWEWRHSLRLRLPPSILSKHFRRCGASVQDRRPIPMRGDPSNTDLYSIYQTSIYRRRYLNLTIARV